MTKSRLDQLGDNEWLAYLNAIGKRTVGYQSKLDKPKIPNEYRSSYNLNHPKFDKNYKYYLHELYNSYTVGQMKQLKQLQYMNLLKQQKDIGNKLLNFHSLNFTINVFRAALYSFK